MRRRQFIASSDNPLKFWRRIAAQQPNCSRAMRRGGTLPRAPDYSRSALASNSSTTSWIASLAISILL
jgi:hypothetical protein